MFDDIRGLALGNSEDLILEHRCYNGVCIAAGFGCISAFIFNMFFRLPVILNVVTLMIGIIYLFLYSISRKSKHYEPVMWLYVLIGSALLAMTWIYDSGMSGPGLVVSMVALVAVTVVLKRRRLHVLFGVFIPIMTAMFVLEMFYPDIVVQYGNRTQRIFDLYLTFVISTFVIFGVLVLILNSYDRERRHLDDANRLLEEKMNELNRTNLELEDALDRVQTLNGLLPICSSCKKIRDDQGYWSQIETYVRQHSRASFTHGICPDCAKKLYPDFKGTKDGGPMNEG